MVELYLKKAALASVALLFFFSTYAQNLVPNGDFENYTSLPNGVSDWSFCVGWNNVNMSMSAWPYATPDYFHTSGTGDGNLPNARFAYVFPQSGNAIMGLSCRHSSQTNARDYIATQLSSPMVIGQTYTISFWITNGQSSHYYGNSCNHFGIQFSTSPLTQTNHESIGGIPQVEIISDVWSTTWQFYTFSYTATDAYQYMTVGNFYTDASTIYTFRVSANFATAYYFVDDIQVVTGVPLGVHLVSFEAEKNMDEVKLDWQVSANNTYDHFTIERSADNSTWQELAEVDRNAKQEIANNYTGYDHEPLGGTSYYRLKCTDEDGKTHYSDVRRVSFKSNNISVYPNPFENVLYFDFPADNDQVYTVEIRDHLGRFILSEQMNAKSNSYLNLGVIPTNGLYLLKISDQYGTVVHLEKITKI